MGLTVGDGVRAGFGFVLLLAVLPFVTCGACVACGGGLAACGAAGQGVRPGTPKAAPTPKDEAMDRMRRRATGDDR
jgi:hypothetical protein